MAAPADDPATLQQARARARRRLIGAVVLLAIGVIVFPILFETRPRALSPDIPITVSRKDSGTVVTAPASSPRPPAPVPPPPDAGNEGEGAVDVKAASSSPVAPPGPMAASAPETVPASTPPRAEPRPEPKADAKPAAAAEPKADAKADRQPDAKADHKPDHKQEAKPEAKPKPEPPKAAAAEASAPAKTGRYVVQVGAFTDALAVREARQKVEKLGLKTYTQEVDTPTGRRTRVRVGPFETKAEADAAGAKLKGAGLPVYLLLL